MNKYTNLELKIKSMSASEIILAMIDGLENPVVKVDMRTYGEKVGEVCYGCAATNFICKVGDLNPNEELNMTRSYADNSNFLSDFEYSIDSLRKGWVTIYNLIASENDFATIKPLDFGLPVITSDNYQDQDVLNVYRKLANSQ